MFILVISNATFASNNYKYREEMVEGKVMKIDKIEDKSNKITTVEYGDFIVKSVYSKSELKVTTYLLDKTNLKNSNYDDLDNYQLIKVVDYADLSDEVFVKDSLTYTPFSGSFYSQSLFFDHKATIYNVDGLGTRMYDLDIPRYSLVRTPYVTSNGIYPLNKIFEKSNAMYSDLLSANLYSESTINAALGFMPGFSLATAVTDVIESYWYNEYTKDAWIALVIAGIESIPGMGPVLSVAETSSYAALAGAKLVNARSSYFQVVNYMNQL